MSPVPFQTGAQNHTDEAKEELVLVLGVKGSGKTTFINLISGSHLDVDDWTSAIQLSDPFELDGRRYRLIDTPGLEHATDIEAHAQTIADFLEAGYGLKWTDIKALYIYGGISDSISITDGHGLALCERLQRSIGTPASVQAGTPGVDGKGTPTHDGTFESATTILRTLLGSESMSLRVHSPLRSECLTDSLSARLGAEWKVQRAHEIRRKRERLAQLRAERLNRLGDEGSQLRPRGKSGRTHQAGDLGIENSVEYLDIGIPKNEGRVTKPVYAIKSSDAYPRPVK